MPPSLTSTPHRLLPQARSRQPTLWKKRNHSTSWTFVWHGCGNWKLNRLLLELTQCCHPVAEFLFSSPTASDDCLDCIKPEQNTGRGSPTKPNTLVSFDAERNLVNTHERLGEPAELDLTLHASSSLCHLVRKPKDAGRAHFRPQNLHADSAVTNVFQ